jgi:hypothetical protein
MRHSIAACVVVLAALAVPARAEVTTMDIALVEDTDGSITQSAVLMDQYLKKIACAFYKTHDDVYDAIFTFSAIQLDMFSNTQQGWPVKQDTKGIGRMLYNQAGQFCAKKYRLRQAVKMGNIDTLPQDPDQLYQGIPMYTLSGIELMGHEFGHHWLASVTFKKDGVKHCFLRGYEPTGAEPQPGDCDGYEEKDYNQHWGYGFNSGGIMYGNNIVDLGGGQFKIWNTAFKYGPLDQYLMGIRAPEEVGPLFLVVNNDTSSPSIAMPKNKEVLLQGTKMEFTVDDVIASEGPREPATQECHWKGAMIVVHAPGKPPTPAQLQKLAAYGNRWEEFYWQATDGRGSFDMTLNQTGKGTDACPAKGGPIVPDNPPDTAEPAPEAEPEAPPEVVPDAVEDEATVPDSHDNDNWTPPDVAETDPTPQDSAADAAAPDVPVTAEVGGACKAGDRMCAGNTALVCPTDGSGWVVWAECGDRTCEQGECVIGGSGAASGGCGQAPAPVLPWWFAAALLLAPVALRIGRRVPLVAALLALPLGLATCETASRHARVGDPCANDTECESGVCDEGLGKCLDPATCSSDAICEDTDPCTKDVCDVELKYCLHEPIRDCTTGKSCRCQDPGVTLEPKPCKWNDATKCSAWESIQHVLGGDPAGVFADRTKACWTDGSCCLVIRCP